MFTGFLAGALAVALFHQGMYWLLKEANVPLQGTPWNMAPAAAAYGLPVLFNQMFWGGLWGSSSPSCSSGFRATKAG